MLRDRKATQIQLLRLALERGTHTSTLDANTLAIIGYRKQVWIRDTRERITKMALKGVDRNRMTMHSVISLFMVKVALEPLSISLSPWVCAHLCDGSSRELRVPFSGRKIHVRHSEARYVSLSPFPVVHLTRSAVISTMLCPGSRASSQNSLERQPRHRKPLPANCRGSRCDLCLSMTSTWFDGLQLTVCPFCIIARFLTSHEMFIFRRKSSFRDTA